MDDNKDIGKAFKNRLSNLSKSPNNLVWDNIVAKLDNKKKKKPLILWFRIAGVAALLLLLISIGYTFVNSNNSDNNQITTSTKKGSKTIKSNDEITVTKQQNTTSDSLKQFNLNSENPIINNPIITKKTPQNSDLEKTIIAKTSSKKITETHTKKRQTTQKITESKTHNRTKSIVNNQKTTFKLNDTITQKSNSKIVETHKNKSDKIPNTNTVQKSDLAITKNNQNKPEINIVKTKKPLPNQINNLNESLVTDDSKTDIDNTKSKKKWAISIKGAPVFYGSLSSGSSLGSNLSNHSKSSDITMSFGVTANYPLNDKLQISTGINNVNLAYNTNDVQSSTLSASQAFNTTDQDLELSGGIINVPNELFDVTQKINYLEIPFELNYNIINKKIGVNVITGFSTLILQNNKILANNTTIGSVNNLKTVSFSGNLGLGLQVKLSKKINFNVDPTLKIQLNAYKNNSDFKPYFLGVYSGFSYQF
jgi:hypothetical protein